MRWKWPRINWDSLFAYKTVKVVKILDRRLGILHLLIQLGIIGYIIGYVLIWSQAYFEKQESTGIVATKVKGAAVGIDVNNNTNNDNVLNFSDDNHEFNQNLNYDFYNNNNNNNNNNSTPSIFLDAADLIVPPTEAGGLFIATHILETRQQQQGWCIVADDPPVDKCKVNSDCESKFYPAGHRCNTHTHQCEYYQWCPSEDPSGDQLNATRNIHVDGVDDFTIWFKASIQFSQLDPHRLFSTVNKNNIIRYNEDPKHANLYSVAQLLGTPQVNATYRDVRDKGAILKVTVDWSCSLWHGNNTKACETGVLAERLDTNLKEGFNFRKASYYWNNGVQYRDLVKMSGIRMFIQSKGHGRRISVVNIILQLSSGIALLSIATIVADFLMTSVLPQRHVYRKCKIAETSGSNVEDPSSTDNDVDNDDDDDNVMNHGIDETSYLQNNPHTNTSGNYMDLENDHTDNPYYRHDTS